MTDSNTTNQTSDQDGLPVSQLPMRAFSSSFLSPPLALYFGHSALSQMKEGTISSSNKAWAQAALAIAYSSIALGIAVLAYLIWLLSPLIALFQPLFQR